MTTGGSGEKLRLPMIACSAASVARDLARNCCGRDGIHKKERPPALPQAAKSREETPKEGSDSGRGSAGVATACP